MRLSCCMLSESLVRVFGVGCGEEDTVIPAEDRGGGSDVCSFVFFQAEDGIRDIGVTGVQTCALPISGPCRETRRRHRSPGCTSQDVSSLMSGAPYTMERTPATAGTCRRTRSRSSGVSRSEERRGGKACRCRWSPYHLKKTHRNRAVRG